MRHHSDRVGDAENDCHVVLDDDDVDRAGHFADFGNRALGFRRAHAAGRLIEQQQLRFGDQRHADLEQRHVAVGQRAGRAVCQRGEADLFERLCRRARARRGRSRHCETGAESRFEPAYVIQRFSATLRLGNTLLICRVRLMPSRLISCGWQAGDVAATEKDLTGIGPQQAGYQVEKRGLAGAIRPDDGMQLSARQTEAEVVDGGEAAETFGQAPCFQDRGAHGGTRDGWVGRQFRGVLVEAIEPVTPEANEASSAPG